MKTRFLTLLLFMWPSLALASTGIDIKLNHGSVWRTTKTGQTTEGFLEIHNDGKNADTLTGFQCSIAATTSLVGGNGKPLNSLAIPAGKTITLSVDGPHLVLHGLHYTVDHGSILPCAFTFQEAGDIGGYLNAVPAPRKH